MEKGRRDVLNGSNPHSNGDIFSRDIFFSGDKIKLINNNNKKINIRIIIIINIRIII